jgi:ABC-type xylose transport system permease subunit
MIDTVSVIIVLICAIIGYIFGFWTGVHYERQKIHEEIIELTTIIRQDGIDKMEENDK